MKNKTVAIFALLALALTSQTSHAQVTISQVGGQTSGGTMPGSPSDYVIFNGTNYPTTGVTNVAGSATNLNSFSIVGGEIGHAGNPTDYSQIAPPGSLLTIQTGAILSPNLLAVGLEKGTNPGFNYNDFNVYVMFSNAPGIAQNNSTIALDGRVLGVEGTPTTIGVTDNNTSLTSAYYVEYNVLNFGSTVAAFPGVTDLVLRITGGTEKDLGGISFQSVEVPEPSTYALMIGGLAFLGFCIRRKGAQIK